MVQILIATLIKYGDKYFYKCCNN